MSDSPGPPRASNKGPDWLQSAPSFDTRLLVSLTLVLVPALLAASVYWLHRSPSPGPTRNATDATVEVRILAAPKALEPPREALPQISPARTPSVSETVSVASERPTSDPVAKNAAIDTTVASPRLRSAAEPLRPSERQKASAFQRALQSHIALYRRYPEEARRARMQGTVQILFSMRRDGSVLDVWVRASSGQRALDAAAVDTIRLAQPLPRIPPELPDRLTILAPVEFGSAPAEYFGPERHGSSRKRSGED
ncbi:energy transducer TonB [Methylosinus sp. Ce-a6]|uniref:energy transducer TonB n=1 Tax=Methylosinus sp. Ce-a6 TaxID=2172005 RepID=UPI0034D432E7